MDSQKQMKLGACYNLFDCEELLETSILSIRSQVDFISVVYQTTSNFGEKCNPHLEEFLEHLKSKGLINSLVFYQPVQNWPLHERERLVSKFAYPEEIGGSAAGIGDQFFNEVTKRELGRLECLKAGCTHFLAMDADEYYVAEEFKAQKEAILKFGWESTACRMRIYGKYPTVEYCYDDLNAVPFIHVCHPDKEFKLVARYPSHESGRLIALDPTRRLDLMSEAKFHFFPRSTIEMHHMTLIRKNIARKFKNVSNKMNYGDVADFLQQWENWKLSDGILHPHPYVNKLFQFAREVPNRFNIDISQQCYVCCKTENLMRCSACKKVRYCGPECQLEDWPNHESVCL